MLDREKRSHFIAAGTDDANRAGDDEEEQVAGTRKSQTGGAHENRADHQHASPPDAIRPGCEVQGDNNITDERQRENESHLCRG